MGVGGRGTAAGAAGTGFAGTGGRSGVGVVFSDGGLGSLVWGKPSMCLPLDWDGGLYVGRSGTSPLFTTGEGGITVTLGLAELYMVLDLLVLPVTFE